MEFERYEEDPTIEATSERKQAILAAFALLIDAHEATAFDDRMNGRFRYPAATLKS